MKKILILGGSHRDIPLIKAAQELGYYVITLGNRDYYLGHKYADKMYKINFNNVNKVKEIINDEEIDFLIPGSGEEAYLITVELSETLGLGNYDSSEVAKLVHNKWKFKEFCLTNNISTPKGTYYQKDSDLKSLNFPLVVKPTNLSGGKGIKIVENIRELNHSIKKTKEISGEIFLEEFIDGKLIAYSIFLKEQKILYGFTGEDKTYLNPYLINTAHPYKITKIVLDVLKHDIEKIAKKLSLVDGMFHLQVIIKDNSPYIIDVTRRIPGDLYPNLIEYCDGVKYSRAVVKAYTNDKVFNEFNSNFKNQKFIIRHVVMPDRNGIFQRIYIDDTLKNSIIFELALVEENYNIQDYLNTQIAIIFIHIKINNNEVLKNINSLIYPIIEER